MPENTLHDGLILDALPAAERDELLARGVWRQNKKSEIICSRGDEGAWAMLIESGLIEISVMLLNGRKSILNHIESGELLGEIALLDGKPSNAEAASDPELLGKVPGIVYRAFSTHLSRKAGLSKTAAQTGTVNLVRRFGSALNLHVHLTLRDLPMPQGTRTSPTT